LDSGGVRRYRRHRGKDKEVGERKVEERIDKDYRLEDKTIQDCCFLLLSSKRLNSH